MTADREVLPAGDAAPHRFPRLRSWAEALTTTLRGERRDAVENRERILATARALIAERGIEAVSMHDIARAAGIGQGTLYRRYPHKGGLCHALVEENMQLFHDALVSELEAEADTVPSLEQLHRSEERRVGKECHTTCRSRWSPYH